MSIFTDDNSPAEELIVLALKHGRSESDQERIKSLYQKLGDDEVWESARRNKVQPMVGHTLSEMGLGEDRWKEIHDRHLGKNSAYVSETERVALELKDAGLQFAGIEGGGVLLAAMHCSGCFVSSDIELLVAMRDMSTVREKLLRMGYTQTLREGRYADGPTRPDAAERGSWIFHRKLPGDFDFWLNIMWVAVLRRYRPMNGWLDTDEILSRAVAVADRPTCIRVPSATDFLLSVAAHTASHAFVRDPWIRLHLDVDRIVRHTPLEWNAVVAQARTQGLARTLFAALVIPKGLWDTPVPDTVLIELVPSASVRRKIIRRLASASVFNRGKAKFGTLGFFLFEAELCDRGLAAGMRETLFPPLDWMRRGYNFVSAWWLPVYYLRRLFEVVTKRAV